MDKITAIIVEDEQMGMEKLVTMLEDFCPNIKVIDKCYDGKTAIQSIEKNRPQLIFLDIDLGGMYGFDVISSFPHLDFEVVLTTAHDEFGIKAVKAGALDYLVKPFGLEELKTAVHKASVKIKNSLQIPTPTPLPSDDPTKLILSSTSGYVMIDTSDIKHIEADDNTVFIYRLSKPKREHFVITLKKVHDQLPDEDFCRISRKYVINMSQFESYSRAEGGYITLKDGTELTTGSGDYLQDLLGRIGKSKKDKKNSK